MEKREGEGYGTMKTIHIVNWKEGYSWLARDEKEEMKNFLSWMTGKKAVDPKEAEDEALRKEERRMKGEMKMKELIKELYESILTRDPLWHFFYEPEIIIRMSDSECIDQVKTFLKDRNIDFLEYDYPEPKKKN